MNRTLSRLTSRQNLFKTCSTSEAFRDPVHRSPYPGLHASRAAATDAHARRRAAIRARLAGRRSQRRPARRLREPSQRDPDRAALSPLRAAGVRAHRRRQRGADARARAVRAGARAALRDLRELLDPRRDARLRVAAAKLGRRWPRAATPEVFLPATPRIRAAVRATR